MNKKELLKKVPAGPMRTALGYQKIGFIRESVKAWEGYDETTKSDVLTFFADDGPVKVEVSKRLFGLGLLKADPVDPVEVTAERCRLQVKIAILLETELKRQILQKKVLARRIGVLSSRISQISAGAENVTLGTLAQLGKGLGVMFDVVVKRVRNVG